MGTLFTSDTHFGHAAARAFYRRPFVSVAAMDAALVERWNEVVTPDDEVWHLGDFVVGRADPGELLSLLNGRKHLIVGNNDPLATTSQPGWTSVQHYAEITCEGTKLTLCHYPFRTWNGIGKGAINLHGHSHGRLKPMARQIDAGVDVWDFRPVTLRELRGAGEVAVPPIL